MNDPAANVWGFPGQGVRWPLVSARLVEQADHPLVRRLVERTGVEDWSAVDPADTRLAQPGILTAGLLAASTRTPDGVDVMVGHSFGELAALVVAEVLAADDALDLAIARGEAGGTAQDRHGGAMLAVVGVHEWEVERFRRLALRDGGVVELAVRNHSLQIVLSGVPDAIERVRTLVLDETEGRAHVLPIGGPFHSPFMADVARDYQSAIEAVTLRPPTLPIVISTNPTPVTSEADLERLPAVLANGLVMPVDWPRTIGLARDLGGTLGFDLGPDTVLARIGRRAGMKFTAVDDHVAAGPT